MSLVLQSAKTNLNVEEVFFSIGKDIKQRLADTDARAEVRLYLRIIFILILIIHTLQLEYQTFKTLSGLFCSHKQSESTNPTKVQGHLKLLRNQHVAVRRESG